MLQMLHFIGSLAGPWRVKWRGTNEQEVAMLKKLILAVTGLALAIPAFADNGHRGNGYGHDRDYGHDRRVVVHERYVVQRPVVVQPVYYHRPAPRPVYVVQQPVYHANAGIALLAGAILGAAIVHSATSGY
jgi:hypothetical protein